MSDSVMPYGDLRLQGEKLSIGSPSRASASQVVEGAAVECRRFIRSAGPVMGRAIAASWPAVFFCGAVGLWIAPVFLLSQYAPDRLVDVLMQISVKPTAMTLLMLSLALGYVVLTGLALGAAPAISHGKRARVCLRVAVVPLVTLCLGATLVMAIPLFFGTVILCFPGLV